ncbi:hypothetical protein RB601_009855 [Gaeumannomyces tritici]
MPSFLPFTSVTGRHSFTLFDIRLENDFIVFRGNDHEASGQLLKGVVAVCVPGPTRIEDIHLRLNGTLHLSWTDLKTTPTGISSQRFEKTTDILTHRWPSFIGTPGKSMMLEKGNYEFPFEIMLPGETCESVEGLREASITYRLKATIARGKFAYDHHAYKHLRVIRTLETSALEFLHAMSVENIWPNKVEYSIVVPRKAVVFGSAIPLETRFTPLLKGLELGDVTIRLVEVCDIMAQSQTGSQVREHKKEREVTSWVLPITREEHWEDVIENTGQEGWVMNAQLDLPRKLGKCIQDVNAHGIKVRHKLKMVVALRNPDGHVSELRATLPVTIFISPNIPLDEDGNLSQPSAGQPNPSQENASHGAPPGYGEHVLDQLYENLDMGGYRTPGGMQIPGAYSGMNSPYSALSRAGSHENLAGLVNEATAITPAALSSRLQDVSTSNAGGPLHRDASFASTASSAGGSINANAAAAAAAAVLAGRAGNSSTPETMHWSPPQSAPLSRHNSSDGRSGRHSLEDHLDFPELEELSKVPSYATAIKSSKVAPLACDGAPALPNYATACSCGGSASEPAIPAIGTACLAASPLELIPEESHRPAKADGHNHHHQCLRTTGHPTGGAGRASSPGSSTAMPPDSPVLTRSRHQSSFGAFFTFGSHGIGSDSEERRRLHLIQARERVI